MIAQSLVEGETWGEVPEVSIVAEKAGEAAGGVAGYAIGYYIDNAKTFLRNLNTLTNQLNDPRTWSDPLSRSLEDH